MKIFVVSRMGGCEELGDDNWDDILGARTTIESATRLLESELQKECQVYYEYQKQRGYPLPTMERFRDGHRDGYKITELEVLE